MLIGLHDAEREHLKHKTFPNYALMKISAYHKARGDTVEWWNALKNPLYDTVYSSKVFDFTPENSYLPPDTIKGGMGYSVTAKLPLEIDDQKPDYSIYPECDYAIGYITRGCPRSCRWCVVPQKEGNIKPYREWRDLIRPDSDKLILMDNNILACDYGVSQLADIVGSGVKLDINQGLDARLVTAEVAVILARLKWIKYIRFSCDTITQIEPIYRAAAYLKAQRLPTSKIFIYLLVTPDITNAAERVDALREIPSVTIYAQAERNERLGIRPNSAQLEFTGRYIYGGAWRKETWREYCEKRRLTP
ncbi:radical SAM protein [Clostridia bacterium]|nr:radical SAM protein [Clostridia bacterium]GHV32690.1 radical SAM protein [Clostridia bacterium]